MNSFTLLAITVVILSSARALADDNRVRATIIGEHYCLHCSLVMDDDTTAECGPDTCSYALKVKEARDKDGKVIERVEGLTLHYISNDKRKKLLADEALIGEEVKLEGAVYIAERAIYIEEGKIHDEFAEFDEIVMLPGGNRASARR